MAYGRSKFVAEENTVTSAPTSHVRRGRQFQRLQQNAADELRNLRALNERLSAELTLLRQREAEAKNLADRDALTGLYNRRRMLELFESAIFDANRQRLLVGLLFIDLNGFKAVNDECGHAAGDKILTTVATRILARVRTGDVVCRYGGDEFVVVLPAVPDPLAVNRVADVIRGCISLPYWIDDREQHMTAAIGESLYPQDGDNAATLLERADVAMYRMKHRLARPMVTLGCVPQPSMARRRNDRSKVRSSGSF